MKLVGYKCENCEEMTDGYFYDSEEIPEELAEEECSKCGGKFKKWNFKKNDQVWHADL